MSPAHSPGAVLKVLERLQLVDPIAPPSLEPFRYPVFAPNYGSRRCSATNPLIRFDQVDQVVQSETLPSDFPIGLSLEDCLTGKGLSLPDQPIFKDHLQPGQEHTITIVLMWPGYDTSRCVLHVRSHYGNAKNRLPITRQQVLMRIGQLTVDFYKTCSQLPGADPRWALGDHNIRLQQIRISDLHRLDGPEEIWQVQMVVEVAGGLQSHLVHEKARMTEWFTNYYAECLNAGRPHRS